MKCSFHLWVILLGSVVAGLGQSQPPPTKRIVPHVLGRRDQPVQPGLNERVSLTPDGDLVIEGAVQVNGSLSPSVVTTRAVHVNPVVTSVVRSIAGGYEYQYQIQNGPGAKQWIQIFWVDATGPITATRVPAYWRVYNIDRSKEPAERVFIGRDAPDWDTTGRLGAGVSGSGFVVDSPSKPGLVRISFMGHKPLPGEAGFVDDENFETSGIRVSEWLQQEILKYLSLDSNSVAVYVIGPKSPASIPALQAVRTELQQAIRTPEFMADRDSLASLISAQDTATLKSGLSVLSTKATGLRAELYSALLGYLP